MNALREVSRAGGGGWLPLGGVAAATVLALATACEGRHADRVPPDLPWHAANDVTFDPYLARADASRLSESFDGTTPSLFVGRGWYRSESWAGGESVAWSARNASVHFAHPDAAAVQFRARLTPFSHPSGQQAQVAVSLNGNELARIALQTEWNEIRVELPAGQTAEGLNRIDMRFNQDAAPAEVLSGSVDHRLLAAVFDWVEVSPIGSVPSFPAPHPTALPDGQISLPGGRHEAIVPLAAAEYCGLDVTSPEGSRRLALSVLDRTGSRRLAWSGTVQGQQRIDFRCSSSEEAAPARLLVSSPGGEVRIGSPRAGGEAAATPSERPPHVFIYLVDTLRADALEPYGASRETSPRIAEFARDAVLYENATSPSSWTLPAVTSVLSGRYPFAHGVRALADPVPASTPWLPELLRRSGYDTLGLVQWPFSAEGGFSRGFRTFAENAGLLWEVDAETVRGLLWSHLSTRSTADPLFAYIHVVDPHALYEPKGEDRRFAEGLPGRLAEASYNPLWFLEQRIADPVEIAKLRALYDGEVLYTDRQFGRFLDLLELIGWYDQSVVVLVSDHGEEFGEHGGFDHGRTLFEELTHVPLMVKYPNSRAGGTRIATRVSTVDILPTVLRSAGVADRLPAAGVALPLADDARAAPRELLSETRVETVTPSAGAVDLWSLTRGDLKCVVSELERDRFGDPAVPLLGFDLAHDPRELSPFGRNDPRLGRCRELVARWAAVRRSVRPPSRQESLELSAEDRANLRALGYLP